MAVVNTFCGMRHVQRTTQQQRLVSTDHRDPEEASSKCEWRRTVKPHQGPKPETQQESKKWQATRDKTHLGDDAQLDERRQPALHLDQQRVVAQLARRVLEPVRNRERPAWMPEKSAGANSVVNRAASSTDHEDRRLDVHWTTEATAARLKSSSNVTSEQTHLVAGLPAPVAASVRSSAMYSS